MRLRAFLIPLLLLSLGVLSSSCGAFAGAPRHKLGADAPLPTIRTFYIKGSLFTPSGAPSLLVGLAKLSIGSTGAYSGTLTTAGAATASLAVTGTISGTMTLDTKIGGKSLSIVAGSVAERIGDPGRASPATTAGMEFQGPITVDSSTAGYLIAIDTSILREYGFAASVARGTHQGAAINGGLHLLSDHRGDLQGYLQNDATSAVYPVLSGTLARGQLLVHLDLLGGGNLVGIASVSHSILNNQLVYKGVFYGPSLNDSGTWLSSPPES